MASVSRASTHRDPFLGRRGDSDADNCALCHRPLGRRVEWHHVIPRSEGGRETVPLHPICHRAIHAAVGTRELARLYPTLDALREHPGIAAFLRWIAGKPPDFHAPTRKPVRRR